MGGLLQVSALRCTTEVPNVENSWNVEAAGMTQLKEDPDNKQSSIIRQWDGYYNIRFPWIEDHPLYHLNARKEWGH